MDCVSVGDHIRLLVAGECCESGRRKTGRTGIARVVHLEVGEDADDLPAAGVLREVDAEVLADGVLIGKEALDEGLIDEGDLRRCGRVLLAEIAAAHHGHADGIEEVCADAIPCRAAIVAGPRSGMALLNDALAPVVAFERAVEGQAELVTPGSAEKRSSIWR